MKLLIVPVVIAAGGIWFNRQQRERELEIAEQRSQDEALQTYLEGMSQLLTDKDRPLHKAQLGDSLSTVARARTLTVLRRLDGLRKGQVVQFLHEAGLITKGCRVIDLRKANLNYANLSSFELNLVDLSEVNLAHAYLIITTLFNARLHQANLSGATLFGAHLSGADLSYAGMKNADLRNAHFEATLVHEPAYMRGANLMNADLSGADLQGVTLRGAWLTDANLTGARLNGVDLSEAFLDGVKGVTPEQLQKEAASLKGATMPNDQEYEEWLKDKEGRREDGENSGPS